MEKGMNKNNLEFNEDKGYKGRSMSQEAWRMLKKNKAAIVGMWVVIFLLVIALTTVVIDIVTDDQIHHELVIKQDLRKKLQGPSFDSAGSILGYDEFGRSILFRLIWGTKYSLYIALVSTLVSTIVGGFLGALAGYYGGKLDNTIMRIMDIFLAVPRILMAIAIVAALGPNMVNLLIAISIPTIPRYARVVRAAVLGIREQEFIESAKALGASDSRIISKYIIPNCVAPIIVQFTLGVGQTILSITALSYLGLGVQPPTPEWGAMLSSARNYMRDAWHITIFPGLTIMITILALNLFGDGLRDALDPKMKK